ncbi:hypothetical protein [Spirochaeta lutea]|uniref:Lipoprotein n=1 Tax=Spirochaeta lutea TaxID=1480694 RepID=A0A098R349_9SPIO|nr:hypothetical protein [Spirochaeta lutea]KGE73157.1 hypothetical protein DC28_05085 [Spirochaeta lutea]
MKKALYFILLAAAVLMLGSCGNTLHNASGVFITKITAVNLPEDGTYALAGGFFESSWDNTNLATASSDATVTWEFETPIEVKPGNSEFKIVQSGTWKFAALGTFKDPHDNANVFDAQDITMDGGNWELTWDAEKDVDEGLMAAKPE